MNRRSCAHAAATRHPGARFRRDIGRGVATVCARFDRRGLQVEFDPSASATGASPVRHWLPLLGGLAMAGAGAQEIAPFRFLGYDGYVNLRYFNDGVTTSQSGAGGDVRSRQSLRDLRQEFFVMTHSYVYHPNFLLLDIGGGPVLSNGAAAGDSGTTRASSTLYNLTGRATILRDKPVRGTLFYEHLNPTVNLAPGLAMTQENERYGFNASVLSPVTPVPIQVDGSHVHNTGRGADRIVDDRIDRLDVRATVGWGAAGSTQVNLQTLRQNSASGSSGLPIQQSSSSTESATIDSRLRLGAARNVEITNLLSLNTQRFSVLQGDLAERIDARMLLDARIRHTQALSSFASVNLSRAQQGDLSNRNESYAAGVSYRFSPDLVVSAGVRADETHTSQFNTAARGGDVSVVYQTALPVGTLQANYSARFETRDQRAVASQSSVVGEALTLVGTAPVTLGRPLIDATTIAVSNAARSQTYLAGVDFLVTTVGTTTRIQRLAAGNILDGQDVLVDYRFDAGGSFAYRQLDQTLGLNWRLNNWLGAYYRVYESNPQLTSGAPSAPLNQVRSQVVGARADVPMGFPAGAMVGGGVEYEHRAETIAPFERQSYDVYAQADDPFFGVGNLRATYRRVRQDYTVAAQNIDLTGMDIRYRTRSALGLDVTADATYESDIGGLVPRKRLAGSLKAQMRYRRASLSFDIGMSREVQGSAERNRALIQLVLRRDF